MDLREWLLAKQWDLHENDSQFARRLSAGLPDRPPIPRQHWRDIRIGDNRVSLKIARAAYGAFPDDRARICELALGPGAAGEDAA